MVPYLYLATFATPAIKFVCLSVSVSCNPCNLCNQVLSVYLSLYLATKSVCLSVSVPYNLCNQVCLSICLCILKPLQPLQPSLSAYLPLYLATFATPATKSICPSVSVSCNPCNLCNQVCLSICLFILQPSLSVYLSLYLTTFATKSVCLSVSVS